jgi:NAD(P)-dependent dehydrogenase (short-subunit alcohol dehydrogenase family)
MASRETVLITGAARRIGRAIALDFAGRGWRVGVHFNASQPEANQLVREITEKGGSAATLQADLADVAAVAGLVPACSAALGTPRCLINNASLFLHDTIASLDPGQWDRQLAVNLKAPVLLAQSFAAHLPAQVDGNIINIIDQRVWRPTPHFFSYSVAKAGLWWATQTLAQALAPRIRVNAIGPGPVLANTHQTAEQFDRQRTTTPLGRGSTTEEIAAAIRFILDAPAMTGQMIALDGGQHLTWRAPDDVGSTG